MHIDAAREDIATQHEAVGSQPSQERLAHAKAAYTTRRVPRNAMATLLTGSIQPHAGDLVLARVEKLGLHQNLELGNGRRSKLYPGDEVVVCYGHRYAPDQFEAVVPDDLGPCHLAAGGGVAARVLSRHSSKKAPTSLKPVGLVGDQFGSRLNLAMWALDPVQAAGSRPYTVAVVGTTMNAGKTTLAASLTRGLTRAGLRVGTAKVTGTGSGNDVWAMVDAGAAMSLDFTDAGFASTFKLLPPEVDHVFNTLTSDLAAGGVDVIVLEVADGLLQEETASLIASTTFAAGVDGVIFASGDAMGAVAGVEAIRSCGLNLLGVGGLLTASPLARSEAHRATGYQILSNEFLSSGVWRPDRAFPFAVPPCDAQGDPAAIETIEPAERKQASPLPLALSA